MHHYAPPRLPLSPTRPADSRLCFSLSLLSAPRAHRRNPLPLPLRTWLPKFPRSSLRLDSNPDLIPGRRNNITRGNSYTPPRSSPSTAGPTSPRLCLTMAGPASWRRLPSTRSIASALIQGAIRTHLPLPSSRRHRALLFTGDPHARPPLTAYRLPHRPRPLHTRPTGTSRTRK